MLDMFVFNITHVTVRHVPSRYRFFFLIIQTLSLKLYARRTTIIHTLMSWNKHIFLFMYTLLCLFKSYLIWSNSKHHGNPKPHLIQPRGIDHRQIWLLTRANAVTWVADTTHPPSPYHVQIGPIYANPNFLLQLKEKYQSE